MALIAQAVWFLLLEVVVTGDSAVLRGRKGSRAMVQCFVPTFDLEDSLRLLDGFLKTQELRRCDVFRAIRYKPDGEEEEYPGDYFRKPLEKAANDNTCTLGVFIVSTNTFQWREEHMDHEN